MQCIYVVLEKCFYRGKYTFAKLRQRHRRRTLNLAKSTPKNIFESRFFVFFRAWDTNSVNEKHLWTDVVFPVVGGAAGDGLEDAVERGLAREAYRSPHFGQFGVGLAAEQLLCQRHAVGVDELREGAVALRLDAVRDGNA